MKRLAAGKMASIKPFTARFGPERLTRSRSDALHPGAVERQSDGPLLPPCSRLALPDPRRVQSRYHSGWLAASASRRPGGPESGRKLDHRDLAALDLTRVQNLDPPRRRRRWPRWARRADEGERRRIAAFGEPVCGFQVATAQCRRRLPVPS